MQAVSAAPVSSLAGQPRLTLVDSVRGFALMGLFCVHCSEYFELYWLNPPKVDPIHAWVFGLFAGKAFALFALMFGLSFSIIMDRAAGRGVDFSGRFAWRMVMLGLFGFVNSLLYRGDILIVLAPLGLSLVVFNKVRDNRLLIGLAGLFLAQPWLWWQWHEALGGAAWANQTPNYWHDDALKSYIHADLGQVLGLNLWIEQGNKWWFYIETGRVMEILGLFLIGLVLGRSGFFTRPETFDRLRTVGLIIALAVWGVLTFKRGLVTGLLPAAPAHSVMPATVLAAIMDGWADLGLMFGWLFGLVSLYRFAPGLLSWLAPVGRMTLSFYVFQSVLGLFVFYDAGLGLYKVLGQAGAMVLFAGAFVAQVVLAHLWFKAFQYGPLEWLWRVGTYLSLDVPFLKKRAD